MAFPESFIQELKMRNSITEVVAVSTKIWRKLVQLIRRCAMDRISARPAPRPAASVAVKSLP